MSETTPSPTEGFLNRFRAGDPAALDALISHSENRLRHLSRRMLKNYPQVRRWEETDDVLQNAFLRLSRALKATPPESARHFYNLAALQIRRELLDMSDRYQGAHGVGANHQTDPTGGKVAGRADSAEGPGSVAEWAEFHRHVEKLPAEEQEVFDLLWYQELTQSEATEILGVSVRTLKRRWQSARMAIASACGDSAPQ